MQKLPQHIFVSGIGTGVGKTLTAAVLTEALHADYWKPVQCGNIDNSDAQVVKTLISNTVSVIQPETYCFTTASSPHYAAAIEGVEIDIARCVVPSTNRTLIIEGAGGIMVPLNKNKYMADLIIALKAPAVLVARNYLGSINHTLLSIAYLKQRGIKLAGIIYSGDNFLDNEEIIQQIGQVDVLGRIDEAETMDKEFVLRQAFKLKTSLSKFYLF